MATHSVIGFQPPAPFVGKLAAATSISNESGEKALFVVEVEAEKSWSKVVPSASFLRSTEVVGESNDHLSVRTNSHTLTMASAVTVTRQDPLTPSGCHSADATGDREVTCVVGPRVMIFGFRCPWSPLVRCDGSGSTQM